VIIDGCKNRTRKMAEEELFSTIRWIGELMPAIKHDDSLGRDDFSESRRFYEWGRHEVLQSELISSGCTLGVRFSEK